MRLGSNHYTPHSLAWAAEQKARDEHADANPRMYHGKEFTKTLALACPWCHNPFFVWQACGEETAPFDDPTAIQEAGMGQRYTCGHPVCWNREQEFQMKQSAKYKEACETFWASKEPKAPTIKPKAKLTKLGG
jgi:hypothetical protein